DFLAPRAPSLGDVLLDEPFEVLQVRLHALLLDTADVDELVVVAVDEVAVEIEHVREAAGEASAEIHAGAAEYAHDATRHVLTAMIARALDDGDRAGIAHRESLARNAGREKVAARRAIQARVAHDHGVFANETRFARMTQHQLASRHALADVVVGIAFEVHVQAAGIPHAEALPNVAGESHDERRVFHAVVAPLARDLAGEPGADGAVEVAHVVAPLAAFLPVDGGLHVAEHELGELALVGGRVRRRHAELRAILRQPRRRQE